MKKLRAFLMACALCAGMTTSALATDVIELAVPTPPGGAVDITARAISKELTNKNIANVVNYYPGAAGEIAIAHALKKQDNVVLVGSSANFVFLDVVNQRPEPINKVFQLYGPSVVNAMMFVVSVASDFRTVRDLIDYAKQKELPCGVSNSHGEIILQQMNKDYSTKFLPVMYKGTGQMMPNIIGGQLKCAYDQTAPYVAQGELVKWLATSSKDPVKQGVATIGSVLPGFVFETWYAVAIPNRSNLFSKSAVIEVLKNWSADAHAVRPLKDLGFTVAPSIGDLNAHARHQTERYQQLLKK